MSNFRRTRSLPFIPGALLLFCFSLNLRAEVRMPGIFGDHMVLQSDSKIPVWGWADPGENVVVQLGEVRSSTQATPEGKWRVDLPNISSSADPQVLTVQGKNTLTFQDVLAGDVWLCSGQSNMEFGIFNVAKKEDVIDPQIRTFCVLKSASLVPLDDTEFVPPEIGLDTAMGHWQKESPAGPWNGFSAVGYYFGKEIRARSNKPVGLIGSYWGGTPAQAWTSLSGLEKEPLLAHYVEGLQNLKPEVKAKFPVKWADYVSAMKKWDKESREPFEKSKREWETTNKKNNESGLPPAPEPRMAFPRPANPGNVGTTTSLFNGMINPLIPYAIKGVIWYQGEANANNPADYSILFPRMISDWREKWGQGDFPFIFVQLAGYEPTTTDPSRGKWALQREAQSKALALPQTGMATAIDIGEQKDIHPKNKLDVAKRAALIAAKLAYGQELVCYGPVYDSLKIEGAKIRLSFKNAGSGLIIGVPPGLPGKEGSSLPLKLSGFEIAGEDGQWFTAEATIENAEVVVSAEKVPAPLAVRYCWSDFPPCSLYNKEGLPAYPFRSNAPL